MRTSSPRRHAALLLTLPLALGLAACAGTDADGPVVDAEPDTTAEPDSRSDDAPHDDVAPSREEVATARARVVTTYDGGLLVLDGRTLELVADLALPGFNRLNPFGDDRHLLVSHTATDPAGFRVLDVGTWSVTHGDHAHHYVTEPTLTGVTFPAEDPGHAVPHGGVTTLFDDATGDVHVVDPAGLPDGDPEVRTVRPGDAHHGFAFLLDDGRMVVTVGDEDSRRGIRVLGADGEELVRAEDCPGVHGEGVGHDETVVVGCEDGVLVYRDGTITKISSPHSYGRIGNQYVTSTSPVALGDYKHDPDQGIGLHEVTLVDTVAATLQVVHLPAGVEYTWRGLGRGPQDEALVLGTDGALHVLDETTGDVVASHPVIEAWDVPEVWQDAHPALLVMGETAYVTDVANARIHAVDLPTGEVYASAALPAAPNEIAGVTG